MPKTSITPARIHPRHVTSMAISYPLLPTPNTHDTRSLLGTPGFVGLRNDASYEQGFNVSGIDLRTMAPG